MNEPWKAKALEIGKTLQKVAKEHPELAPLCTSWRNFARKHRLHRTSNGETELSAILDRHGLTLIAKADVDQLRSTVAGQADEIKALEFRITTLLQPEAV